jgi:predicted deacylase
LPKYEEDQLIIGGNQIERGERKRIELSVAKLYDFTEMNIPIEVIRGTKDGPILFISGAIHGDEINGVEIIRHILERKNFKNLKGTLIAVPVVNIFGFNNKTRYLPDGRDLNRSFPGSNRGSLTSRVAHIFMKEVVSKCSHGIDLHTGAIHRSNFPQIRASLENMETLKMAKAFSAPVILDADLRDGSLREAARKKDISMLLYEGGEALRFEEDIIRIGVRGCLNVMRAIGMLPELKNKQVIKQSFIARESYWLRAPHSGTLRVFKKLGDKVDENEVVAHIVDLFGSEQIEVIAPSKGVIIGESKLPLVNKGDAIFHIAAFKNPARVEKIIHSYEWD